MAVLNSRDRALVTPYTPPPSLHLGVVGEIFHPDLKKHPPNCDQKN